MDLKPIVDFMRLANNPVVRGDAGIEFGLASADRVEARIYDVSGRVMRTLADRRFVAGVHRLVWDGADDRGVAMARACTSPGCATATGSRVPGR